MPERYGTDSISSIGVFAHEYGHALGLPDLYDTDGSSAGIGKWGIMSGGSWNQTTNPGDTPAHFMAWSKYFLGWVTPTKVNGFIEDEEIKQAATNKDSYMLLNNPSGVDWNMEGTSGTGEYFLLENRQKTGFDAGLPGAGLMIWHIYEEVAGNNSANTNEGGAKLVDVEEADGRTDLDSNTNSGDDSDPFPGSSDNRTFAADTTPDSKWYDGRRTGCGVFNISDSGETMTADFGCRFAVTHPAWDDIGAILDTMGFDYFELFGEYNRLENKDFIDVFDAIFINCAGDVDYTFTTAISDTVKQWVSEGNGLYASDYAYTYVNQIFPGYINFPADPKVGNIQTITADVTDGGLASYIGSSSLEIVYDLGAWVVIDSVGAGTNVLLTGDIETSEYDEVSSNTLSVDRTLLSEPKASEKRLREDSILAASFMHGAGTVVYTTFHNEANISGDIQKFLEYAVLLPISSEIMNELITALTKLGYNIASTLVNTISQGEEKSFTHTITKSDDIAFALGLSGSTMKLSVYKPDNSLFNEKESTELPIIIEVPQAEAGKWTYKVTAVDVPSDNYPFAAAVGGDEGGAIGGTVSVSLKKGKMTIKKDSEDKDKIQLLLEQLTGLSAAVADKSKSVDITIKTADGLETLYSHSTPLSEFTSNKKETKLKLKTSSPEKHKDVINIKKEKFTCSINKTTLGSLYEGIDSQDIKIQVKIGPTTYETVNTWTVKDNEKKTKLKYKK